MSQAFPEFRLGNVLGWTDVLETTVTTAAIAGAVKILHHEEMSLKQIIKELFF